MQKRILIWSASYAPALGGLQTTVSQLARGLQQRGNEVRVLTNRTASTLSSFEIIDGIPVYRYRFFHPVRPVGSLRDSLLAGYGLLVFPARLLQLWWFTRLYRPDVINVHFPGQQIWYIRLLQKLFVKTKWVISLHGNEILQFFETAENAHAVIRPDLLLSERIKLNVLRNRLQHSYAVTACSGYLLNMAGRLLSDASFKGHVVYNGINYARFSVHQTRVVKGDYIVAFGRLAHVKGFDLLLRAFEKLPAAIKQQYSLVIAGTGPEKSTLEKLAIKAGIQNRIQFFGRASETEVASLLQYASLVVVPSRQETFGISLLEAIAANCKIVATNVGGMPEIAGHGNVLLCEPLPEALSAGMSKLLLDNTPGNSPGYSRLNGAFTEETMLSRYEEILLTSSLPQNINHA